MGLVTSKEVAKAIGVEKLGILGTFMGWSVMQSLRISKLNKLYDKHKEKKGIIFLDAIIDELEVKFEIHKDDLKRIPKDGAFITISNHPLGGIDGIILLKLLLERRDDYKIIANFLLQKIEPLEPFIMPVNPLASYKDLRSSIEGVKAALDHLKEGKPLGIFPAGEVSTHKDGKLIVDKPWEEGGMKLVKKAKVPVVPIYFHAKNSKSFYFVSKIKEIFRTAKLPSEVFTQKNRVIKIRIGKPIPVKKQDEFEDIFSFQEFLRKKTYMLAKPFEKKKKIIPKTNIKIPRKVKSVAPQRRPFYFEKEIDTIRDNGGRLLISKNYEVFLCESNEIPEVLHEIGRLREITFRDVGEGTNNAIDLDNFDYYYHHLILWDSVAKKVAGAYRMGLGKEIYEKKGINGFYIQSLFRIEPELHDMMKNSIEMGRAFISKEYQQKPMPLFLLWKGIVHVTLRFPEYKYLIGGVSISNQFSDFSKSLMIEFMKSHYYDPYVAQYIHPKKEYKVKLKDKDKDFVFDATSSDMQKFDKIIDELEPGVLRIPVLIKKYVKQNARLVAFNVDPQFNDAVDGLMYIKIADIPESTVKPVMEEFLLELENKAEEAKRNASSKINDRAGHQQ